jgi:hypothetical protein
VIEEGSRGRAAVVGGISTATETMKLAVGWRDKNWSGGLQKRGGGSCGRVW